jgi:hypothetical protein
VEDVVQALSRPAKQLILLNTLLQKILLSIEAACSEAAARNARKII